MICSIRDIPIHYEQYGEGIPVLCIHGYSADHRLMTGCLEPVFTQLHGYRRIYPDLPGMGRSPAAAWLRNADDMLALIKAFADAVLPNERFLVIGESYGGYLALGLLRDMSQNIDGAMLICPAVIARRENRTLPPKQLIWKSKSFEALPKDSGIQDFLNRAVIATPELYQKYQQDILSGISLADSGFLSRYSKEGYGFSFESSLLKTIIFEKPMSILTGRQDHVVGYRDAFALLDQFPRATFAVLDGAGHNLQFESELLFHQHVLDWLQRTEGDALLNFSRKAEQRNAGCVEKPAGHGIQ